MINENKRIITSLILSMLIVFSAIFFLYKLGEQSLHPWDEAWYAAISRNIISSKNITDLKFNTFVYWDHPPLGFYLESLSFLIFGINDFSARLPQALLGLASIILIFLTGKKMGSNWIGFSSALILLSCRWFLFRARTGNLDILLLFTQLLVFYFSLDPKFKRHLYLLWSAFALSLLSKSFISITLAPLLIYPSWQLFKKKIINIHDLYQSFGLFIFILSPWYLVNTAQYGSHFLKRNLFEIGFREGSASGIGIDTITKTLNYLHAACHKWYKLFLISSIGLPILTIIKKDKKSLQLLFYLFLVSFPYFLSSKTEIWHLIPILAPLSLVISSFIFKFLNIFFKNIIFKIILFLLLTTISLNSLKTYYHEFINTNTGVSDIAIIAPKIPHDKNVFLSNDQYYTSFIFYADLEKPIFVTNRHEYQKTCKANNGNFYAVAMQGDWLDKMQVEKKLISKQKSFKILEFSDSDCKGDI